MVEKEWTGTSYSVGEKMDRRQAMIASEDQIQQTLCLRLYLGNRGGRVEGDR